MADPSFGYPVNTEIEAGKVAAGVSRGSGQKHFYMDSFTLLKIGSYNDFSFYQKNISWELFAGGERIYDARADKGGSFFAPAVKAGAGLSHIVSKDSRVDSFPSLIVYGMVRAFCRLFVAIHGMAREPRRRAESRHEAPLRAAAAHC